MPVDPSLSRGRAWHADRANHALLVTLAVGESGAVVADRLRAAVAAHPPLPPVSVWSETLPLPADDPRAARYRERELCRALAPDAAPLRVLVVGYRDDRTDLVLTARRDVLGQADLHRLAAVLSGTSAEPIAIARVRDGWGHAPRVLPAEPAWGLGERRRQGTYGVVAVELPSALREADLLTALALVLHRYEPGPVRFAAVTAADAVHLYESSAASPTLLRDLAGAIAPVADPSVDVLAEPPAVGLMVVDADGDYRPGATPPFPITILWRSRAEPGLAWCWYEHAYLHPSIATQFARQLERAVRAVRSDDGGTLGDVPLMTTEEIAEVLACGRTPATGVAPAPTIHAAVEASARARPDAVAYSDENGGLTYGELVAAAGSMAGALRECGVAAGTRVGVCLDRGADLIVVLLAILRAGAAYVPMDVRHPAQRLRFTTQDAGIRHVVTDFDGFPEVDGVRLLPPAQLRATGTRPPPDDRRPDDPAYVIYTSGSTGRPKGVSVPHRNVLALLAATTSDMGLRSDDVWTWFHSPAFDFAVWEIWGSLMTGARLVGVPLEVSRSPEDFAELLRKERVTILNQTPSAFGALQRVDRMRSSTGDLALRLVIFGGETLDVSTLREWFDAHPHTRCRLVNMFGITETTVHVTTRTVTPLDVAQRSRSVGTALPGWSVSVRDERARPVPFGVAGEIFVGGAGVATGYLDRAELTAQRFLEDPYGGGRVYRSGDYGRLHPDGSLDHLGRIDSQVQLRGHRVELEEIRAVLLEEPSVQAAAVMVGHAIPDDPTSARLDAYVVTTAAVTAAELRRRVSGLLPEYMVPSTVTILDSMPLTVNGKVDTARLPKPVIGRGGDGAEPAVSDVADTGAPVRSTLRRVWAEVFDAPVADDDDFFELGGNSLLALRLAASLRAAGLPPITMRELYLHPRIDDIVPILAARADDSR